MIDSLTVLRPWMALALVVPLLALWGLLVRRHYGAPLPSLRTLAHRVARPPLWRHLPRLLLVGAVIVLLVGAMGVAFTEQTEDVVPQQREIFFIFDFSGSMNGEAITVLRDAFGAFMQEQEALREAGEANTVFSGIIFADEASMQSRLHPRLFDQFFTESDDVVATIEDHVVGDVGSGTQIANALQAALHSIAVRYNVYTEPELLGDNTPLGPQGLFPMMEEVQATTVRELPAAVQRAAAIRKRKTLQSAMVVIVSDAKFLSNEDPPPEWVILLLRDMGVPVSLVHIKSGNHEPPKTAVEAMVQEPQATQGSVWTLNVSMLRGDTERSVDRFRKQAQTVLAEIDRLHPEELEAVTVTTTREWWFPFWALGSLLLLIGMGLQAVTGRYHELP